MNIIQDILDGNSFQDPVDGDLLVLCIQVGKRDAIDNMLCSPDITLPNGLTPLEYAIRLNRYEVAEALLKKGADPNLHHYCYPPLMETKDINLVKLLLDHGAEPDIVDENGRTALMNSFDINLVKLLLDRDATINLQDKYGRTALHHLNLTNDPEISKLLKERGADLELEDNLGMTPVAYSLYFYKMLYVNEIL